MRQQIVDRWIGVALIALAAIWSALAWTTMPASGVPGAPGPRAFPLLLGGLLGLLGAVMAAVSLANGKAALAAGDDTAQMRRDEVFVVGGGLALFLAYAFLLDRIGFLAATPLIVILALRLALGARNWLAILLVAAGLTAGCYIGFGVLLQANLPHGTWAMLSGS